jgi:hypothetical protein
VKRKATAAFLLHDASAYDRPTLFAERTMRAILIILGLVLLVGGLWVVFGHGSYTQTDTLLQVGSAKLTAKHDKAIPEWMGISGIVVGALLAVGGLFSKR